VRSGRHRAAWAGALAAALAAFGPASVAHAFATLASSAYVVGTATAPTDLRASTSSDVEGEPSTFSLTFVAQGSALGAGSSSYIQLGDSDGNAVVDSASSAVVADLAAGSTFASQSLAMAAGGISLAGAKGVIKAGDSVEISFRATNPSGAGPYLFYVATSGGIAAATSGPLTFVPPPGPPGVSLSSRGFGSRDVLYMFANVPLQGLSGASTASLIVEASLSPSPAAIAWGPAVGDWSVTYSPSSGRSQTLKVTAISVSPDRARLTLSGSVPEGEAVTISGRGTNPCSPASPCPGEQATFTVTPGLPGATPVTVGTVSYWSSVSAVTAAPSVAGTGVPATYTVGFVPATSMSQGAEVTVTFPAGASFNDGASTNAVISDATAGTVQDISSGSTGLVLSPPAVELMTSEPIAAGDSVSVIVTNVANPEGAGIFSLSLSTSTDPLAAQSAPYVITSPPEVSGLSVTVMPPAPGALATYTLSGIEASQGGLTGGSDVLTLQAPGTAFPSNPGDYSLTDATDPSRSATASELSGGGTAGAPVTITVPDSVVAGDNLTLVVDDVVNPTGGSYTVSLAGNISPSLSPSPLFPRANVTYPNGAIVSFGGTIYVFAGGHPFGIPSPAALAAVQATDKAAIVSAPPGAEVPTSVAADGTTISAYGHSTIYVVVGGELYGFAGPAQFVADGYDPGQVITVPSLGGMAVSPTSAGANGSAATALATAANGAIVDSGGTYYVFAGGRAFGVPSAAALRSIEATDAARPLAGPVGPGLTGAPVADGTLLSVDGAVYVSYGGLLYPFKSVPQLEADGYGGTAPVAVPSTGGLSIQASYLGS
jgi:hypothetical protein